MLKYIPILSPAYKSLVICCIYKCSTTAWVNWDVDENPPMSRVLTFCSSRTLPTAVFSLVASSTNPRCSSILALANSIAVGLATLRPRKDRERKVRLSEIWKPIHFRIINKQDQMFGPRPRARPTRLQSNTNKANYKSNLHIDPYLSILKETEKWYQDLKNVQNIILTFPIQH